MQLVITHILIKQYFPRLFNRDDPGYKIKKT